MDNRKVREQGKVRVPPGNELFEMNNFVCLPSRWTGIPDLELGKDDLAECATTIRFWLCAEITSIIGLDRARG